MSSFKNRYIIKSGSPASPNDKIPVNSTLEINPINKDFNGLNLNVTKKDGGFIIIQKMTNSGEFNGDLNPNIGLISSVRISFTEGAKNWILITEITFLQ